MKNFAIVPNEASKLFSPRDLYTLTCMYFTTHSNGITDITIKQLSDISGTSISYIKNRFLPRLKLSGYYRITTFNTDATTRRNNYYLPNPNSNFKIIDSKMFKDNNLTFDEKGFLIGLYTTSVNNTFSCGLSHNQILKRLKISKNTFLKYKKSLLAKGYIIPYEDEVNTFTGHSNFDFGFSLNCSWLGTDKMQQWYQQTMKQEEDDEFYNNRENIEPKQKSIITSKPTAEESLRFFQ